MLKFSSAQQVLDIGGVEVGGQPGERPTVLVGSIFFAGHGIVHDAARGLFDETKAKALLDREAEVSTETGNPRFIDVIGETSQALINYIRFVADHTSSPMLVDSPSQRVRLEVIRHFAGSDVAPRLIYNAIAEDHTDEEATCLRECGVKNSIVLAFSSKAVTPGRRRRLLENELLPAVADAGVENALVDTGVTDVPSVGWASLTVNLLKEELGYPAGCAPANAIYTWQRMKDRGTSAFRAAAAAVLAMPRLMGADFLLYGSVADAPWVYPAVAAVDGLLAYGGRFTGVAVAASDHPLYRVF